MRWTLGLSRYVSKLLIKEWSTNNTVDFKATKEDISTEIHNIISTDLNREKQLEVEVEQMLDKLDITHPGQFERYKMYPLLKKQLAKKQGIIL